MQWAREVVCLIAGKRCQRGDLPEGDHPVSFMSTPDPSKGAWSPPSEVDVLIDGCLAELTASGPQGALRGLRSKLQAAAAPIWLDCARVLLQRGQPLLAAALLDAALARSPHAVVLRHWFGLALWQAGEVVRAEVELRRARDEGGGSDTATLLAQVLRGQGKLNEAATVMAERAAMAVDVPTLLECAQFIRECQRQDIAAGLCEGGVAAGNADPRLHALAGALAQELGRFDQAQAHYREAIEHNVDMNAWFVLNSLASVRRYTDRHDADFALLQGRAHDPALSPRARAAILFGMGKARDDVGDFADAVQAWREANALMRPLVPWSRAGWNEFVASRMAAGPEPSIQPNQQRGAPIFVVGLPRTGTTLVAELLGRHPDIRNRGELPTLGYLAERLIGLDKPRRLAALSDAAAIYLAHLRRDDAPARYYIDKNPLNFRYLDLIAALFPQARVIHCRRHARDTALSIWGQSFASDDYGFATDFRDIAALGEGCERLVAHWRRTLPLPILTVEYEQLVADPDTTIARLVTRLELASFDPSLEKGDERTVITSASQWQARQSIHRRSVERWRNYADYLPQLTQLFPA